MKKVSISWAVFWLSLFGFLSVLVYQTITHPYKPNIDPVEAKCAANNGIPIYNSWGNMIDCKIYKK